MLKCTSYTKCCKMKQYLPTIKFTSPLLRYLEHIMHKYQFYSKENILRLKRLKIKGKDTFNINFPGFSIGALELWKSEAIKLFIYSCLCRTFTRIVSYYTNENKFYNFLEPATVQLPACSCLLGTHLSTFCFCFVKHTIATICSFCL